MVRGSAVEIGGRLSITKTTVTEFATELNLSPAALLKQLTAAGVAASSADAPLSASDKGKLLDYLRKQHGAADESAGKRITLTRKSTTELRTADASGKSRTVQVEVRKKRVLVTRASEAPSPAFAAQPAVAVLSAEEVAAREAEAARDAALREAQERSQLEKQAREAARSAPKAATAEVAAEAESAATEAVTEPAEPAPAPAGVIDPQPGNNSDTDVDTLLLPSKPVPTLSAEMLILLSGLLALGVRRRF